MSANFFLKIAWAIGLSAGLFLLLVVVVLAVANSVTIDGNVDAAGDWNDEYCLSDAQGVDDQPGQKDLTRMCAASNYATIQPANIIYMLWAWDDTRFTGANTGDGCALFDTDRDGNINFALCVTIDGDPPVYNSSAFYSCDDSRTDRCAGSSVLTFTGACAVDSATTDPFSHVSGCNGTNCVTQDPNTECSLPISDFSVPAGAILLSNVCSFPSTVPNSDPSDCILDPATSRISINTTTGTNSQSNPTVVSLVSFIAQPPTDIASRTILVAAVVGFVSLVIVWRVRKRTA